MDGGSAGSCSIFALPNDASSRDFGAIVGANVSVRLREDGAHPLQRWSDRVRFSQANGHDDGVDDALGLGWSVVALLLVVAIVE